MVPYHELLVFISQNEDDARINHKPWGIHVVLRFRSTLTKVASSACSAKMLSANLQLIARDGDTEPINSTFAAQS